MVATALIGAGATLAGSAISSNATKKASNTAVAAQSDATAQNTALVREQMARADAATAALTPYAQAGAARLASRVGLGGNALTPSAATAGGNPYATSSTPTTYGATTMPSREARIATDESMGLYNSPGTSAYFSGDPGVSQQAPGSALKPTFNAYTARSDGGASDPTSGLSGGTFGTTVNPTYQTPDSFSYTANDYTQSPGYQFQLEQGLGAIQSSQAARGALYSGATLKALEKYAQGLAAQDFSNERNVAYGQYTDAANRARSEYTDDRDYLTGRYDRETGDITTLTGIGQQAVNQQLGASAAGTNALTANNNLTASTAGNAAFAKANATNGLVGNALTAGGQVYSAYANNGLVNSLATGQVKPNSAYNAYSNRAYV